MSAQPSIRRAAIPAPRPHSPTQPGLAQPRCVFSPLLYCDLRHDMAAINAIEPGVITFIGEKVYQVRNQDRVKDPEGNHPEFVEKTRLPGYIVAGLLRVCAGDPNIGEVPTGFMVLEELTGLNPEENPADGDLINDLQETLLPRVFESGREQWEWLNSDELERICYAKDSAYPVKYYNKTRERLIASTQFSIDFAEAFVDDLAAQMAARAKGGPEAAGNRKQIYAHDKRMCAWAEREVPSISSQLKAPETAQPLDLQGLAQMFTAAIAANNEQVLTKVAEIFATNQPKPQPAKRLIQRQRHGHPRRDEIGDSTETQISDPGTSE